MKLLSNIEICKNKKGEIWSNILGTWQQYENEEATMLMQIYRMFRCKRIDLSVKTEKLVQAQSLLCQSHNVDNTNDELSKEMLTQKLSLTLNKLIAFFTEFNFEPNFRFVNTLTRVCSNDKSLARNYILNYFALTDNSYTQSVEEKMRSLEFDEILETLNKVKTNKVINKRFKLYYGSQGTGKTTQAMQETNNNVMVCHSAMLPSDLMEDFKFNDGKAAFTPSALCNAMTQGKSIVLDEINLLPFESLRFLQSILDDKKQFDYKGQIIEIKDGFQIIGTMNLQVNGMTYALPEPLVDRASELRQFKLTADNLMNAIM